MKRLLSEESEESANQFVKNEENEEINIKSKKLHFDCSNDNENNYSNDNENNENDNDNNDNDENDNDENDNDNDDENDNDNDNNDENDNDNNDNNDNNDENDNDNNDNNDNDDDNDNDNNDNNDNDDDNDNDENDNDNNVITFFPDVTERQVISKSLALIGRSNRDDWNDSIPIPYKNVNAMILREKTVFYVEGNYYPYDLIVEIQYDLKKNTSCKISYKGDGTNKKNVLYMFWTKRDKIIIEKDYIENRYFFFSRKFVKRFIKKENDKHGYLYWCDHRLARDHLYDIS